jgi:hypothetical protein
MHVKDRLYQLYVSYFDQRSESFKEANRFVSSVGADWLRIERLSQTQFFDYLSRPGLNAATKRRWLDRILQGYDDEKAEIELFLRRVLPSTPVKRPHFLDRSDDRVSREKKQD